MAEFLTKILPVILIFFVGIILRWRGIFRKEHGDDFIKLVFYVSLPGLIMNSLSKIELTLEFALLPVTSAIIIICMYLISYFTGRLFRMPRPTFGVFLIGTMILNNGFLFPFILEAFGDKGFARLIIFDFSNGLLTFTFTYYQACKYGRKTKSSKTLYKKFLFSIPIWAIAASLILNTCDCQIPGFLSQFFKIIGDLTIPLLMLTMGIYFTPRIIRIFPLLTAIFIRMVIGFALGLFLCYVFNIEGLSRIIVLISSAAPIGFNNLTFASLEDLDREFAASLVSIGILFGLVVVPILIVFLR